MWCRGSGAAAGPLLGISPMRNSPTAQKLGQGPVGPCQPLQPAEPRACLSAGVWPLCWPSPEWGTGTLGVLKILFRKHRGNFSFLFPFPGIVDPMKELTPLLLVTKWLVDMAPLIAAW